MHAAMGLGFVNARLALGSRRSFAEPRGPQVVILIPRLPPAPPSHEPRRMGARTSTGPFIRYML